MCTCWLFDLIKAFAYNDGIFKFDAFLQKRPDFLHTRAIYSELTSTISTMITSQWWLEFNANFMLTVLFDIYILNFYLKLKGEFYRHYSGCVVIITSRIRFLLKIMVGQIQIHIYDLYTFWLQLKDTTQGDTTRGITPERYYPRDTTRGIPTQGYHPRNTTRELPLEGYHPIPL